MELKNINSELSAVDNLPAVLRVLSSLIDSIEIKDDNVYIKTSKNIIIQNEGNTVTINSGYSVNIAKEIHLNPDIKKVDFKTLEYDLEEAKKS